MVALSARVLTRSAARAGFIVHAADLFADLDTVASAASCATLTADRSGILPESLARVLARMQHLSPDVVVFGSGFEGRPGLIDTLASAFPGARMAGCSSTAVAAVKDPAEILARVGSDLADFAPVQLAGVIAQHGWLTKTTGASGGAHVRAAEIGSRIAKGTHAQRRIAGDSTSALFLSDGSGSRLLGLCRHWRGPDVAAESFVHSGLVTLPALPDLETRVVDWGHRCAAAFGLYGLWGCDFIVDADGRPVVVEVNPRPTASLELLEGTYALFSAHIDPGAFSGQAWERPGACRASLVCHALAPVVVPAQIDWPAWVADRPAAGGTIAVGRPVCTVLATADTPERAVMLALDRRRSLDRLLAGADVIEKSN